jgi:DNA-binding transcriptional MocR family regulator
MIAPYQFTPRARLLDVMRQSGDPHLINLAAGLPSSDCIPKVELKTAFDLALGTLADEALGYHTPDGDYGLRELLTSRFAKRGIHTTAEKMVITTGCTQALHGMIRLFTSPGDIIACEAPAYYATLEILGDLEARVLPIPVKGGDGVDLDLVATLFARYRPKAFVVCSTLSNPSGATLSNQSRNRLLEICRSTGTHIIEDEIYGDLSEQPDLKPIRAFDNGTTVSYVTSFSKTVAPGIRVGVCLPGGNVDRFARLKCQQDMHSATLCEVAFRKYLELGSFDRHLDHLRNLNAVRRRLAIELIAEHFPKDTKIIPPAGGFLLWAELPGNVSIDSLYQAGLQQGVAFCPATAFYPAENEIGAMRLNCSRPTEGQLIKGLRKLGHLASASLGKL